MPDEGEGCEVLPEFILLPIGQAGRRCLSLNIEAYLMIAAGD